nr:replication initiator [Nonomuraea gerenzanensis]
MPSVLARLLGLTRKELRRTVRLSYAKVAEYQARGLVHFHAVIRLDGPDGPTDRPRPIGKYTFVAST